MSPPAKQDQCSKEPDPVALPKTGSGLTWLTEKQKTKLTSLIQDLIQSVIGQVVSQATRRVLEVVRPSPQPSGQQEEDPDETKSSTGPGEEDQHVEDMLSEEEPQLEEENAIQIPPRSDGSLLFPQF